MLVSPTGILRHLAKLRCAQLAYARPPFCGGSNLCHMFDSCWYPQQESNLYQGFRKPPFYPVELWGQCTIFYSHIFNIASCNHDLYNTPNKIKGKAKWETD